MMQSKITKLLTKKASRLAPERFSENNILSA